MKDESGSMKNIMNALLQGKRDVFFKLWNRYVPVDIRENDINALKTEFYIQIYFTIYPIHLSTGKS